MAISFIERWLKSTAWMGVAGMVALTAVVMLLVAFVLWLSTIYDAITALTVTGVGLAVVAIVIMAVVTTHLRRARDQSLRAVTLSAAIQASPALFAGALGALRFVTRRPLTVIAAAAAVGVMVFIDRQKGERR